jgi:hypothetical protein
MSGNGGCSDRAPLNKVTREVKPIATLPHTTPSAIKILRGYSSRILQKSSLNMQRSN